MSPGKARWQGPPPSSPGGRAVTIEEILSHVPAEIRRRAREVATLDPTGLRQFTLVDDPYRLPFAYANPCQDANGQTVYAIWCDGEPVGVADSWTEAHLTVELLCMFWRSVGPQDMLDLIDAA